MRRIAGRVVVALVTSGATVTAQDAPAAAPAPRVLSLADALREADRHAFTNRIAGAATDADRARARLPLRGILPSARIEAAAIRTTDPIGAFGTTLRQRLVTPAAFDPARLNNPVAVTNAQGGLVFELPLLNADAWTGGRAARASADATAATSDWTVKTTRANVVRAYYGGVLAVEKIRTLEQAQRAAEAALRQVQSMLRQGIVTKADALQASVRATELASQLLAARNDVITAQQQLGMLLGRTDGTLPPLPDALPSDSVVRRVAERDTTPNDVASTVSERADVRAANAGVRAAVSDRQRAASTMLPRLNSFARYEWNAPNGLFAGRKNWTVGLTASWSLFGGGSELADLAGATARAMGAAAGAQTARMQSTLEADAARRGVAVALLRLSLAEQADLQSREAHRLVERRYIGGVATIAELLGAEASATGSTLAHSAARYALLDALATHRRASGADPAELSLLESAR